MTSIVVKYMLSLIIVIYNISVETNAM